MKPVLSLFPGVGLLDRAFEDEGFCIVRGPDLLWGGDIKRFHPPAGAFAGIIGGPPCQKFSSIGRLQAHVNPNWKPIDLIPEFERCIAEARPRWFLMENVPAAPVPAIVGYAHMDELVRDVWVGGETTRFRRFTFGIDEAEPRPVRFQVSQLALHIQDARPAVLAQASRWVPVAMGGNGQFKQGITSSRRKKEPDRKRGRVYSRRSNAWFREACRYQGLPEDFDLPGFTISEKIRAIGNGVPYALGRAVAQAVRVSLGGSLEATA